jgi:hypothetical protein
MEKVIPLGLNGYNCDRNARVNRVQIECISRKARSNPVFVFSRVEVCNEWFTRN